MSLKNAYDFTCLHCSMSVKDALDRRIDPIGMCLVTGLPHEWTTVRAPACEFTRKGRGECLDYVGIAKDGDTQPTDEFGKPLGWCWECWRRHQIQSLRAALGIAVRALEWSKECVESNLDGNDLNELYTRIKYIYDETRQWGEEG